MANLAGEIIIRKGKTGIGYYTSKIHKNENDEIDDKLFITVYFPFGTELEDFTKIKIIKGFDSYYPVRDEDNKVIKRNPIYIIQEYEIVQEVKDTDINKPEEFEVNVDDLPF